MLNGAQADSFNVRMIQLKKVVLLFMNDLGKQPVIARKPDGLTKQSPTLLGIASLPVARNDGYLFNFIKLTLCITKCLQGYNRPAL
jgi:hypothetical protein